MRCSTRRASRRSPSARGLPVPRRFDWEALDAAARAGAGQAERHAPAGTTPACAAQLFGGAGKARIFASGREARAQIARSARSSPTSSRSRNTCPAATTRSGRSTASPRPAARCWNGSSAARSAPIPRSPATAPISSLARDERLAALGRDIARAPAAWPASSRWTSSAAPRTGRYYLLEINTRFNLWHYLGASNGVNLPQVAYDFLVNGKRPAACARLRPVTAGSRLRYDWRAYRELSGRGELGAGAWLASLAHARWSTTSSRGRDPLPFVRHWATTHPLPRFTRRMHRWLSTAS